MVQKFRLNKNGLCGAIGTVQEKPEVKYVGAANTPLATFSIWTGKNDQGNNDYLTVKAWRDRAFLAAELENGQTVLVVGTLNESEYNGKKYIDLNASFISPEPIVPSVTAPEPEYTDLQADDEELPF